MLCTAASAAAAAASPRAPGLLRVPRLALAALLLVLAAALAPLARAEVFPVRPQALAPRTLTSLSLARVYAPQDAPAALEPGNGRAFVTVDLTVTRALSVPPARVLLRPGAAHSDPRFHKESVLDVFVLQGTAPADTYFGRDEATADEYLWCRDGRVYTRADEEEKLRQQQQTGGNAGAKGQTSSSGAPVVFAPRTGSAALRPWHRMTVTIPAGQSSASVKAVLAPQGPALPGRCVHTPH